MPSERRLSSTRERFREQMRSEIKEVALTQLLAGGIEAISLNAIGKELSVTGSALYRYYANRDDLLSALVIDTYIDLRDALAEAATTALPNADVGQRVVTLAHAYRGWANLNPHRYELLFKPPIPGYDAHSAPLAEAARSLMGVLLGVIVGGAVSAGGAPAELNNDEVLNARSLGAEQFKHAVRVWSRLHGFVSLEIGGSYAAMQLNTNEYFEHEVKLLTESA